MEPEDLQPSAGASSPGPGEHDPFFSKGLSPGVSLNAENTPSCSRGTQDVTLKINQDEVNLKDTVAQVYQSKQLSDLFILCQDGKTLKVHSLVVVTYSQYFQDMVLSSPDTDRVRSVKVDADSDLVGLCLDFMYTGQAVVPITRLHELLGVAELLRIDSIQRHCLRALYKDSKTTRENCFHLWSVGLKIECQTMIASAWNVALKEFDHLQHETSFTELSWDIVKVYLADSRLRVQSPDQRLMAALVWVKSDVAERVHHLPDLLEALPLTSMTEWCLKHTLHHDSLFMNSEKSKTILNQAIKAPRTTAHHGILKMSSPLSLVTVGKREYTRTNDSNQNQWCNASTEVSCLSFSLPMQVQSLATLPTSVPSDGLIACCANESTLYVSGVGSTRNEVFGFHVPSRKWKQYGNLNISRLGHCMAVCDGNIYVIGGRKPGKMTLVTRVELLLSDVKSWRVVGQIQGSECANTCCAVAGEGIVIYGVHDHLGRLLLQLFSTLSSTTTSYVSLPYLGCAVYGVAVAGDHIIMCDFNNTSVCSTASLYQNKDHIADVTVSSIYKSPNTWCVMSVEKEPQAVLLVGGSQRSHEERCYVYMAPLSDVITGRGPGWQSVQEHFGLEKCEVTPAAFTTMVVPTGT